VDFKNTVIIMTSNIGSQYLLEADIGSDGVIPEETRKLVMAEMKRYFRPEFLNRIDETVVFKPLTREDLGNIIELLVREINKRLEEKNLTVEITDDAKDKIIEDSYDVHFGARPIKRYLQKFVETGIGRMIIRGELAQGDTALVEAGEDGLKIEKV